MFKTRLLLLLILIAVIPVAAAQDSVTVTTLDSLRGDEVSLHSGPGVQYTEIVVSFGGLTVPATGRNDFDTSRACTGVYRDDLDMWLRVQFNELEGWVWRCHPNVQIDGDLASLPVVNPTHAVLVKDAHYIELTGSNVPPKRPFLFTFVTYNAVLLRTAPNLDSPVLGKLTNGTGVYIIGRTEKGGWAQVVAKGHTGWIASHLVSLRRGWEASVPVT